MSTLPPIVFTGASGGGVGEGREEGEGLGLALGVGGGSVTSRARGWKTSGGSRGMKGSAKGERVEDV